MGLKKINVINILPDLTSNIHTLRQIIGYFIENNNVENDLNLRTSQSLIS
jgi:hypothetical protein